MVIFFTYVVNAIDERYMASQLGYWKEQERKQRRRGQNQSCYPSNAGVVLTNVTWTRWHTSSNNVMDVSQWVVHLAPGTRHAVG